ncbi:MAG: pyruvate dehydrogenase (acetyl-transferring) E1 component subunit alpha [Bacteroidetes bacterium]|jgi:pyruvate dehydrogenase E1 component alpha subunit|nr:pyruvate dehydrogenase (acetyl-transferring) E1 component subunit alpha [Bacteroidota bacterium]
MANETKEKQKKDASKDEAAAKAASNGAVDHAPWTTQSIDIPDTSSETYEFQTYPVGAFTHDDLDLSDDEVVEMYRSMMLQRRFEERCRQMYQRQKISGFLHLYIGQEAVSTGSVSAIRLGEDTVITAYRDHGIGLAMGMDPGECMAELFGKADGCSRGKGGSMHFFDAEKRMFGGHGIVGAQIPVGVGIAFAHKYKGEENVCLTYFGDGAINQGAFHEAANLAQLYELPVVLVCENNQYGMGTSVERASAEPDLYKRASSYRMPGAIASGMDVFSVHKAIKDATEMARTGQPSLLEVRTYRYQGHSISDPAKYRAEGELDDRQSEDAIVRLQRYIVEQGIASDEDLEAIDEEVKQDVLDAIDFAENSPEPAPETIYEDIYVQDDYPFIA